MNKVKHQIFSDFHGEFQPVEGFDPEYPFGARKNEGRKCPVIQPEAQRLILAGDIFNYPRRFEFLARINALPIHIEKVIFVPGNHEYYKAPNPQEVDNFFSPNLEYFPRETKWSNFASFGTSIDVDWDNKIVYVKATLWSNILPEQEAAVHYGLSDFRTPGLTPEWYKRRHERDLELITGHLTGTVAKLKKSDPEFRSVVVTHHCPTFKSSHERFLGSNFNSAFCTNLEYLMEGDDAPDFWIHGHTHDAYDYTIGKTRIICNPVGYPGERKGDNEYADLVIEI
jgi:predicted phosphodiesterase